MGGGIYLSPRNQSIPEKKEENFVQYLTSLVYSFPNGQSLRGKQARLMLWETLEHFDLMNGTNKNDIIQKRMYNRFHLSRTSILLDE